MFLFLYVCIGLAHPFILCKGKEGKGKEKIKGEIIELKNTCEQLSMWRSFDWGLAFHLFIGFECGSGSQRLRRSPTLPPFWLSSYYFMSLHLIFDCMRASLQFSQRVSNSIPETAFPFLRCGHPVVPKRKPNPNSHVFFSHSQLNSVLKFGPDRPV